MDDMDRQIFRELESNGRQSFAQIASKIGTSISTVERRVKQLLADDVFSITAVANPVKMGWLANAIVSLAIDIKKEVEICDALSTFAEIHYVGRIYGRYDVMFFLHVENPQKMHVFIQDNIAILDGVNKIEVNLISKAYKRYGSFPLY